MKTRAINFLSQYELHVEFWLTEFAMNSMITTLRFCAPY